MRDPSCSTLITSEIDFDQDGKQLDFLRLPHSVHRSAYGWLAIPVICIKNGDGPQVLLTAGNHGDEYEGQLALMKLCQALEPKDIRGRIIMLTATNFPAAIAGTRVSPIDDLNLNRVFPGTPRGRPTELIADYLSQELLPNVDYAVDLHSGGSSLMYLPSALSQPVENDQLREKQEKMLEAFAAPLSYWTPKNRELRSYLSQCQQMGVAAIGTELGGGGCVTMESLRVAERGVKGVLKHLGSVPDIEVDEQPPTRMTRVRGVEDFVYSPDYGIWEPLAELGDDVSEGQPAAAVYSQETPWRAPVITQFQNSGTIICRRVPGQIHRGDCLFHLAGPA